jgi:hypothetical protein
MTTTTDPRLAAACLAMVLVAACSRSNNLLLGRVEADLGSHQVVVTDCYRLRVPALHIEDTVGSLPAYRFKPCRDADVLIRGAELFVNARPYVPLQLRDSILVDHGVVSILHRPPSPSSPASGEE